MNFLCWLGLHRWFYGHPCARMCGRCFKVQLKIPYRGAGSDDLIWTDV